MLRLYSKFYSLSRLWLLLLACCWHLALQNSLVAQEEDKKGAEVGWVKLLPDTTLEGWEKTNFGGEGKIEFNEAGDLVLGFGEPLTGIHSKQPFPKSNYEVRWQANRLDGSDFLACLTAPIGDSHFSFICGGWGGGLIGISSIDGNDASENQTSKFRDIKNEHWYAFRLRVDATHLKVWMDDEELVSVERKNKRFSIRAEVGPSRPFGYCVFKSKVALRHWEFRQLDEQGQPIEVERTETERPKS